MTGFFAPIHPFPRLFEPLDTATHSVPDATVVAGEELEKSPAVLSLRDALLRKRNAIILDADHLVTDQENRQVIEFLNEPASRGLGYLNLVFRRRDTLSAPFVEEAARKNRCRRILVRNSPTRDAVLCGDIMNLLDAQFGDVNVGRRAEFMLKLEALVQKASLEGATDRLIEPLSRLEFYPVPRDGIGWPEFAAAQSRYTRDPCGFLLQQFERYIECGLLYSGHIRTAHRELYDAVRFSAVHTRRFETIDKFFVAHDILVAADLADPSSAKMLRAKTVLDINVALAGRRAVLGHVATHGKRSLARRTPPPATDPH
jgi:hypothetical protein